MGIFYVSFDRIFSINKSNISEVVYISIKNSNCKTKQNDKEYEILLFVLILVCFRYYWNHGCMCTCYIIKDLRFKKWVSLITDPAKDYLFINKKIAYM